jgi:NADH-quinone oxidoreductase subunit L
METAVLWIPVLPLIGFLVNGLMGRRLGRPLAALVACAGPIGAAILAIAAFRQTGDHGRIEASAYTWIATTDLHIPMTFVFDRLSGVLALVVTGVGSLIHVYSAEYMEHETPGGYARYFAYLNLFTAMMLVLVLGSSLPLLFIGWEGVGLCSYLLIGFWYGDKKNADAGKKAFIVNRVGDFGFLLGIFLLFSTFKTVDMAEINHAAAGASGLSGPTLAAAMTAAALLLFLGACGKSAQIPLYVWLPDAMAGPTPVSALIHAATMVTAGVYMIARMGGLFLHAGPALPVVAGIGIATAFFAATMGLAEWDLKKVLAYSTISQLGYMFVGVGTAAFGAGIFHLVTHAFFKALLFLAAGAVMHALDGITDMRLMGGLRRKMPITAALFTVGALALAGIPPFAGFFSKDEILWAAFARFHEGHGVGWLLVWILGVLTAAITAFYTFRAVTLTFFGEPRGPADVHIHAHEPGLLILVPLAVLAVASAAGGFLNVPPLFWRGGQHLGAWLAPVLGGLAEEEPAAHAVEWIAVAIPTLLSLCAAGAAAALYRAGPKVLEAAFEKPAARKAYDLVAAKYRVDEAYDRVFVQPLRAGAAALWEWVDVAVIDNAVNGIASAAGQISVLARWIQAGVVNRYAFYLAGGAVAVLLFVLGYAT